MILRLGGVPLHIGAEVIAQFADKVLPLRLPTKGMSVEDRMVYVAQKTAFMTILPWVHKRLRRMGIDAPPPVCPKGMDYLNWATLYAMTALFELGKDVDGELIYQELPDGSLLLTGLAPALAGPAADASAVAPLAAPQAPNADFADPAPPRAGADDRGVAVGPLVHPGPDGQRQDAVCEAADPGTVDTVSPHESVRAG